MFKLIKKDEKTKARLGSIETSRGKIDSPFFMPVGTNGTVKSLTFEDLLGFDSQIILSNTYHLFLRPGMDVIRNAGGLHRFINWQRPILTDSGGYQVFSLTKFRKISEEGVEFRSHIDGSMCFFTPEEVIKIEGIIGSDIIMPLDVCAPYPCERKEAELSVSRTYNWARRSKDYFMSSQVDSRAQKLFGIIQGATYKDLRIRSAEEIMSVGFDGYAIGGVSVGEPVEEMFNALNWVMPLLPEDKPRYFMGIGLPDQIVKAVSQGIDMFDTCIPTRYGRHGTALTSKGKYIVRNAEYINSTGPIDENCDCRVCKKYSLSFIRHLLNVGEILGLHMVSYHNVYFYVNLMRRIRAALAEGRFNEFKDKFLAEYGSELK
ncbi:MAG: tRNA guanosine(34) transglycosylase Tgt [Candidatus Omnitrophica bacterium]|nr:tRNA guanosine(34) transglycosylase Tgt [Candidatus Omnitrophota bacterium]